MMQMSTNRGILHNLNQMRTKLRAKASSIEAVIQDPKIAQQPKDIRRIQVNREKLEVLRQEYSDNLEKSFSKLG